MRSGLGAKKGRYFINVIHFVSEDSGWVPDYGLNKIAKETRDTYKRIKGMDTIERYVSGCNDEWLIFQCQYHTFSEGGK